MLGLQRVQIGGKAAGFRVGFGIAAHRDFEIMAALQGGDQFGGAGIATGYRLEAGLAARRVTAQRHDMAHTGGPIFISDSIQFLGRRVHAGEVRGGRDRRFLHNARHRGVGAFPRRPASAISDRHKAWVQWHQCFHGLPQAFLHRRRFRRKKLKAHRQIARQIGKQRAVQRPGGFGHLIESQAHASTFSAGFVANHSVTPS